MVLIPLGPTQLPATAPVNIPGPGPTESHSTAVSLVNDNAADSAPPPPPPELKGPPLPPQAPRTNGEEGEEDAGSDVDDDDDAAPTTSRSNDPYSNLDGAFGNYLADEPRPMGASARGRSDIDDLLF